MRRKEVGEAFDATPANIEARTKRVEAARRAASSRCCRRRPAAARCSRRIALRFGDVASLKNLGTRRRMATAMLMRGTHQAHAPAAVG